MSRVLLASLGGTISMTGSEQGTGVRPALASRDLLGCAAVPHGVDVVTRDIATVPGADLGLGDILDVAAMVRRARDGGFSGVVITQGTDTLEETAFALDLLVRRTMTTVLTGAMRHPAAPGADGPANLADALAVAASAEMRHHGVLVVLAGEIHAARYVRKTHTMAPGAFCSYPGPLGWVAEGRPEILLTPVRRAEIPPLPGDLRALPRVDLVPVVLGQSPDALRSLAKHSDGVVVTGFGAGHVPRSHVPVLEEMARTRPVVLASRVGRGPLFRETYGFPGSETDLLARGLMSCGALDGPKARVALTLLLAAGAGADSLHSFFSGSAT